MTFKLNCRWKNKGDSHVGGTPPSMKKDFFRGETLNGTNNACERAIGWWIIEQCGNGPRRFHNGLTLAVPERRMVVAIQNAVRLILTLELLQGQKAQLQLTPQQEAELAERKRKAENELKGGISQLYPVVYTPQYSEQQGPNLLP